MKTFTVFRHPTLGFQAVKVGFSWPGFFFTLFWTLVKKLWGQALGIFGVIVLLVIIETAFENEGSTGGALLMLLAQLAVYIGVGIKGNEWRVSNLQKRGFQLVETVQAETPEAAIGSVAKS
jgi:hypothetical protein